MQMKDRERDDINRRRNQAERDNTRAHHKVYEARENQSMCTPGKSAIILPKKVIDMAKSAV